MIASNSAPRHETSQGRQKNGRVGVRKEGREKCHTFLGTNLRGETAATPLSLSPPVLLFWSSPQHPPPRGPVYCFTYSPTATGQQRYFVYKFWLLWEGEGGWSTGLSPPMPFNPCPTRQFRCTAVSRLLRKGTPCRQWTTQGGVVFWHVPRTFRGWQARHGMSYWRRSRLDLKGWHRTLSLDVINRHV